jgi:hypothetical protein
MGKVRKRRSMRRKRKKRGLIRRAGPREPFINRRTPGALRKKSSKGRRTLARTMKKRARKRCLMVLPSKATMSSLWSSKS